LVPEHIHSLLHQVQRAQSVVKARMQGARVYKVCQTYLPYPSKTLEIGVVYQIK
ncbi:MAG: hypothetical protein JNJ90_20085, partial [Saprospiraceae bacterium]|nr:hypothetical protein [Saprospiraceae bacterium]